VGCDNADMTVYLGNSLTGGSAQGPAQPHHRPREAPAPAAVHAPVREAQPLKDNPRPVAQASPGERPRRDVPRGTHLNIVV
jgi:hypothetical protein